MTVRHAFVGFHAHVVMTGLCPSGTCPFCGCVAAAPATVVVGDVLELKFRTAQLKCPQKSLTDFSVMTVLVTMVCAGVDFEAAFTVTLDEIRFPF